MVTVLGEARTLRVRIPIDQWDELITASGFEALGESVLLVDTGHLENAFCTVAHDILTLIPKGFNGFVYISYN